MDAIGQPTLEPPRRLERHDRRGDFTCGNDELDQWFHRYSWQNQKAHNAVTYVAQQGGRVAGYYALAAATIRRDWSPASFAAHRPQSIPCMLLARLAVDRRVQGQGVGTTLLLDALRRTLAASDQFGIAALLIHCKDEEARAFYMRHVDALESAVSPLQLVVPTRTIARALGGTAEEEQHLSAGPITRGRPARVRGFSARAATASPRGRGRGPLPVRCSARRRSVRRR